MSEYGPGKEYIVKCLAPKNEYPVPEFLEALDTIYCVYQRWAVGDNERTLADALTMYAMHKQQEWVE